MNRSKPLQLSIVVPLYNEAAGLQAFHNSLIAAIQPYDYEIIYCNDGSQDNTFAVAQTIVKENKRVRVISLSRNFGKENTLAAGIAQAHGAAVILLDGDGQHPVDHIPQFIEAWQRGAKVVIGLKTAESHQGAIKHYGAKLFYALFNKFSTSPLIAGSSDFLLIDREVQQAFLSLPESDRITRGLIDWLGFDRSYVEYAVLDRQYGTATYSHRQLLALAANSFVSLTTLPLYMFGFIGAFITSVAFVLGISVGVEQLILNDPLHWKFTGTAMLSILLLFLVGILLSSQGMLGLYISHIHNQSKRRPLYIIDRDKSVGLDTE